MLRCVRSDTSFKRICRDKIRCVLEFEDNLYLIINNSRGANEVLQAEWNYYQGFNRVEQDIPESVLVFARKIIELNTSDATRYPLRGEWYLITLYSSNSGLRWNIRRTERGRKTTAIAAVSCMLHFAVAMAFAGFITLCTAVQAAEWLSSMFSSLGRAELNALACTIEFVGCAVLFVASKRRSIGDLYFNAFIPVGLVIMAGLLKCYWWAWIVIPIGACVTVVSMTLFMTLVMKIRDVRVGEYIRGALAVCTVVLMVVIYICSLTAYSHASNQTNMSEMTAEQARVQYEQSCVKLEKSTWDALTVQQKLDVLQTICDYESEFILGCESVKIYSGITRRESILGEYTDDTASFMIKEDHLKYGEVEDVLNTALHELRHAYQYSLVKMYVSLKPYIKDEYKDLLPFKQAQSFLQEFASYCDGKDDYDRYFTQEVEIDCREWSEKRIKECYTAFIYPER